MEVDLLPEYVEDIKKNKVTLVKNFSKIEKEYDFNLLMSLFEKTDVPVTTKNNGADDFFKTVFQIKKLENTFEDFKFVQGFLKQVFKYLPHNEDSCDIFFSFKSGSGLSHVDEEDVFIIGLNGVAVYKIFGEKTDYHEIHKGDLIYIPKGIRHKVIGLSPRITLSVGFFGAKI